MKCIHWTISEIDEHYSEIEPEELWYENTATPDTEQQVDYANDTSAVFDLSKVVGLRETHLLKPLPENQKKQVVKTMAMTKVISCTKLSCKLQLMRCLKRSKGYLEKKHVNKVCSVILNLSINLTTIQEVPLFSSVEMRTSIIKRSPSSYSLVSIEQS